MCLHDIKLRLTVSNNLQMHMDRKQHRNTANNSLHLLENVIINLWKLNINETITNMMQHRIQISEIYWSIYTMTPKRNYSAQV